MSNTDPSTGATVGGLWSIFRMQWTFSSLAQAPTGLTLAGELRRQGVNALAIDKHAEGANTSRAAVVHARTLEILEPLGATSDLLAEGLKVSAFKVREGAKTLATVTFDKLPSAYPFTLMIPQDRTEAVLLARLKTLGGDVLRPAPRRGPCGGGHSVRWEDHDRHRQMGGGVRWLPQALPRIAAGVEFDGGTYPSGFPAGRCPYGLAHQPDEVVAVLLP